jgi:hypothetical protein
MGLPSIPRNVDAERGSWFISAMDSVIQKTIVAVLFRF